MRLCDFPILSFDTYGTLIDWETGIWDALQPLCARLDDPPDREAALAAFAREESACQAATPGQLYSRILAATHRNLARRWGCEPRQAESVRFGQSAGEWPALAYLHRHHRLLTLTNCDRASYRGSAARLGGRRGGATFPPQEAVEPDFRFNSMAAMVAHHRAERSAGEDQ